ncbi:YHYH protein [Verrucomicrobiaceae bacterium 227]
MKAKSFPVLTSLVSGCVLISSTSVPAHEWHFHQVDGAPVESDGIVIPESEGDEPANSAAVAERAEAFAPYRPKVQVRWDDQWFYIESNGIPAHDMMTGITAWQQQVPVPQNYYGNNAWQIPLNPQPAAKATPVSTTNLLKGAVAIAVNGVPIFNLYNNRGENTFKIGELDQWGGHCGRADDYHYHIVPHHLSDLIGETAPLAYALDGYAILGSKEADGSAITVALDENQGHSHGTTGYHYHALAEADYSITGLYGKVTLSRGAPENQILPQARTSEFRPALRPLRGAEIKSFAQPNDNSFSLTYQRDGDDHVVNWSVDRDSKSIFYEFVDPSGTTSETHHGWQGGPEAIAPELSIVKRSGDSVQLRLTGTPKMSYPFSWSADREKWERFGFLQLDDSGKVTFTLESTELPRFLTVDGSGISIRITDPVEVATMSVTRGAATPVIENLYPKGRRVASVGTITAIDGTKWTVPSDTHYQGGNFAPDLFNSDKGVTPRSIDEVDLDSVPIVEIDADGEVITGYIFADNYFELYVNGKLVGIDPIPFTEFNSNIVRFRAKAPINYAFKLVDWEENLGLGSEANRGNPFHAGDAGLIASFSDGTVTNADWKAQVFYIAPVDDPANLVLQKDGTRDTSAADQSTGSATSYGLHWKVPANWLSADFDDSTWPNATTFTNEVVGVDNKPSYTNFDDQFAGSGASFIWSSNLVLDNEVIVRYTTEAKVKSSGGVHRDE